MDEGAGTILLMLHGWGDSLHTFDALTAEIPKHRIIRLDLPGFGGSEQPPKAWTVGDYAVFVGAFLEKIVVQPDTIVGHSLGGRIAIKGTADGILTPRKLVLIASAGNAQRNTVRNAAFLVAAKAGKAVTTIWPLSLLKARAKAHLYKKAGSDYADAGLLRETFLNVIREDLSKDAARVDIPTLLIWGDADTTTPLSDGRRFANTIPHAHLEIIGSAGHFVHSERASDVARIVLSFI